MQISDCGVREFTILKKAKTNAVILRELKAT